MRPGLAPDRRGGNPVGEALALFAFALATRVGAAFLLGGGAPFGPDGTGLEAAVTLGGHLYPGNVALIAIFGGAQRVSVLLGALTAPLLWGLGRRLGLGGVGGWLWAAMPLGVYTGALAAGDAPALCVVLLGAFLATFGRLGGLLGGALAMGSVLVKPVALPALGLLLFNPWALVGAALTLPWTASWLGPLLHPKVGGGLLGSWWVATGGAPVGELAGLPGLLEGGLRALGGAPLWTGAALAPLAVAGAVYPAFGGAPDRGARWGVLGPLVGMVAVAALFGERLEPRYLTASLAALCPWIGALTPPIAAVALLWPSAALVTQVAAYRAQADPAAGVPLPFVVDRPEIDARPLFDEASVEGATTMRLLAADLARTAPIGDRIVVEPLPHGREGELVWPLLVARPDLRIVRQPAGGGGPR